jgi:hypothetical protein
MIRKPIVNPVIRTIKGKGNNIIEVYRSYAVLVIKHNDSEIRYTIDLEDVDRIKKYKWYCHKDGSCSTNEGTGVIHNFIMNSTGSSIIHIDGNKFNCRKSNLRHKNSDNNKLTVSAPVIETKEENDYKHIRKIGNGFLITIENEEDMFYSTEEEAKEALKNKLLELYESGSIRFI